MRLAKPLSRRLFAAVALHGIVDFAEPVTLVAYPACLTIPDRLAVPVFAVASVAHFAQDLGFAQSLLFHLLLVLLPPRVALAVLDVFMVLIHLPCLFVRILVHGQTLSLALLFSGFVAGIALPGRVCRRMIVKGVVVLKPIHLKIVSAHCLTAFLK